MNKLTNHERATKAAAARWGGARQKGVRIYIDEDAAKALFAIYKSPSLRRKVVSEMIRITIFGVKSKPPCAVN